MNGNDLLNAMTDVDDKHIIESEKKPVRHRRLFIGAMSAAAAVVITVTAVSVNTRLGSNHAHTSSPSSGSSQTGANGTADSDTNSSIGASGTIDNSGSENNQPGTSNGVSVIREPRNDIVFPSVPTLPETNGESPILNAKYYEPVVGMGGPGGSKEPETDIGNFWSAGMSFETLPAYYNFSESSEHDYMIQTLKCVAETFGYDISEMDVKDNFFTEESERKIREQWEGYGAPEEEIERMIRISKTMSGEITASFKNEITISLNLGYRLEVKVRWSNGNCFSIPDEYKPTSLTMTEMDKAGRYVLGTYNNMFIISNPVLSVKSSSDNRVEYYEGDTDAEKFVNYQLNRFVFEFNPKGDIVSMQFRAAGMKKVGDYPIISVDEATEGLYNNRYFRVIATVDHDFSGTEPIGAIELVYLDDIGHLYAMPFYHFEVGLTSEEVGYGNSGETRYFAYYVPAITDEYLGDWESQSARLPH